MLVALEAFHSYCSEAWHLEEEQTLEAWDQGRLGASQDHCSVEEAWNQLMMVEEAWGQLMMEVEACC